MWDLSNPGRVLINGSTDAEGVAAAGALADIYADWVPRYRILTTNFGNSELLKLVAYPMIAQKVSSMNSISKLCEKRGADVSEVSRAIGAGSRIGPKLLDTPVWVRRSLLPEGHLESGLQLRIRGPARVREVRADGHRYEREPEAGLHEEDHFKVLNTATNKRITVLSFAFKKDTGDVRETPAIAD